MFRFFDIVKPQPIKYFDENKHGGKGVFIRLRPFFPLQTNAFSRREGFVLGDKRRQLQAACARLDQRLDDLDARLQQLAAERHAVAQQRRTMQRRLWPPTNRRGRKAAPNGREALPPLPYRPVWLYGRRLRAVCLAVLARLGPTALPDLHAHLHRLGFGINHPHAVKALAEAMGYETDAGRAVRLSRGVYGVPPGTPRHLGSTDAFLSELRLAG